MKSGFFGTTKSTTTSSKRTKEVQSSTTRTANPSTSIALSKSKTVVQPLEFNLYPKVGDETTLHWSFYPDSPSTSNPSTSISDSSSTSSTSEGGAECIFYATSHSITQFQKTNWYKNQTTSKLPSLPSYFQQTTTLKGKGKALIANCNIPKDTLILYDRPFIIYDASRPPPRKFQNDLFEFGISNLTPSLQIQFQKLANALTGPESEINYLGKIETNSFPLIQFQNDNLTYNGGFLNTNKSYSSLNHSCFANTLPFWNQIEGRLEVRTNRDVKEGEELTACYIIPFQKRRERRYELLVKYKFHCECEWCSLNDKDSAIKDEEREKLAKMFLKEWDSSTSS